MASNIIHLWDNSWHASNPDETQQDSFGRRAKPLNCKTSEKVLRALSSSTIGELMKDEESVMMVWPNSFFKGNEELKDQYIFRISEKDGKNINSITTYNVVGFIGKGNTDIRIHSRFSNIDAKGKGDDYFLYYMIEKLLAINMFSLTSSSKDSKDQVFDFLLFFFPKLLKEALSQGIFKKYVYHEYNDSNLRGVVDVNRHIRYNIPANGKIAYRTREFSYDNNITQLIRHTIEFIRRKPFGKSVLHNDPETEACVQQIIQATPTFVMQKRQTVINENLRPITHPYYTKYAALQNLCLRILRHERLSYGQKNDNKIYGLLIDAAWLWEEYIAQVLSENTGLKHYTRDNSKYHLFRKNNKPFQTIIPDYYDAENKIVADAKYIPLHKSDHLDADRAAFIYYKTIMYMYRFDTEIGFLFHPVPQEDELEEQNIVSDYTIEERDNCHLYEVGLVINNIEKNADKDKKDKTNYSDFRGYMKKREEEFCNRINKILEK